jgi:hypothetical protein
MEQAIGTMEVVAEHELGCERGKGARRQAGLPSPGLPGLRRDTRAGGREDQHRQPPGLCAT